MKSQSMRTRFAAGRPARAWVAALALLAMAAFLLQPALCWPRQLRAANVQGADAATTLHAGAAPCALPGAASGGSHGEHGGAECCGAPDAVAAQVGPVQSALSPVPTASPATRDPLVASGIDRYAATETLALEDPLRERAVRYHARTERQLT